MSGFEQGGCASKGQVIWRPSPRAMTDCHVWLAFNCWGRCSCFWLRSPRQRKRACLHLLGKGMERIRGGLGKLPQQLETFPLAVLRRDVKTLYVALIDTHEKNHGRGIRILEEGGVKVEVGLQENVVGAFLKPYLLG